MNDPLQPQAPRTKVRTWGTRLAFWRWRPRFSLRTLLIVVLLAGSLMVLVQRWDPWCLALQIPHPVSRATGTFREGDPMPGDEERTYCFSDFVLSREHVVVAVMDKTLEIPASATSEQASNPFCRDLKHLESELQVWHIGSRGNVSSTRIEGSKCYLERDPGEATITVELRDYGNRNVGFLRLDPATGQTKPLPPRTASASLGFSIKDGFWGCRNIGPAGEVVARGTCQQGLRMVRADPRPSLSVVDGQTLQQVCRLPWPSGHPINALKDVWFAWGGRRVVFVFDPQPDLVWGSELHDHRNWVVADADTGQSIRTIDRAHAVLSEDTSFVAACSPDESKLELFSCFDGRLLYSVGVDGMFLYAGAPCISPDNRYIAIRNGMGISIFERRWPEEWWGILVRPEFLFLVVLLPALVWSIHRDRRECSPRGLHPQRQDTGR